MNKEISKAKIKVKETLINIVKVNSIDYISLTDLAMWEELFNENFKLAESRELKKDSATQSFTIWVTKIITCF